MARGRDMERMLQDLRTAPVRLLDATADGAERGLRASVELGYARRQDIYGKRYIPAKDGHLPQMERTGTLRSDYQYQSGEAVNGGRLVKVSTDTESATGKPYDRYLRDGTPKMAPRKHIPSPDEPPPPRWDARINSEIGKSVKRAERMP